MVCYWRVFGVEFGTYRLIISIIIYCASFAVVGDNFTPVISVFPTKSHEMRGQMNDRKLHDGVDVAFN
jgi:hypothetical protein